MTDEATRLNEPAPEAPTLPIPSTSTDHGADSGIFADSEADAASNDKIEAPPDNGHSSDSEDEGEEEGEVLRAARATASTAVIDLENDDGIQLEGSNLQGLLNLLSDSPKSIYSVALKLKYLAL